MFRPLALFIGLRYTRAKRRNYFISFISGMSMMGMALGVMILIIVMSVMNGFNQQLQTRILGMVSQATISRINGSISNWPVMISQLEETPGVKAVAPLSQSQGLATANGVTQGIMLNGIEPLYERNVSIIDQHIIIGSLESLRPQSFHIVIGDLLAQKLGVNLGDKITILLPNATVSPLGAFPRLRQFTVTGIFSVGAHLDQTMVYIDIQDAGAFLRLPTGNVQSIRLKVSDLFQAPQIAWRAASKLQGEYYVDNWTQSYGQLFSAIHMEKVMVGLLLSFLIAIAAFNIISTLIMVVTDKQGNIAILRTFGASTGVIMGIFIVQGTVVGCIGTFIGAILGIVGALNISSIIVFIQNLLHIQFLNSHVYFINFLPSQLQWYDVFTICTSSLVLSFLATLYPAWRASRMQPAEVLRYE